MILSVQKQNFSNIEIIIIDDGSEDNSDNVIKELTKEDERIISIKNKRNRGTLYSKTIGVINAKGKYVMTLDHDDFYANEKVFYTLYNEAEKYNLDLLGFASINTTIGDDHLKIKEYINYIKTPVIKQPNIKKRFLGFGKERSVTLLCMYFIKTNLFKLVIKKLGDIFINRNIDAHDDTIIMFLLSRNASSLKHLKDIFYIIFIWPEEYSASLNFQKIVKYRERTRKNCFSYLTFAEVLLMFSQNNEEDKFVAEYYFLKYFIREEECKNKKDIINNAIRICILYLDNKFISNNAKREISLYLYELIKYNKNDIKNKRIFY